MKQGKCDNKDCTADLTSKCHIGNDTPETCTHWKVINKPITNEKKAENQKLVVPWSGDDFKLADIEKVSRRGSPLIFGIVGQEDSGKTSFLGALFTLLINGYGLRDYSFCGSETLLRWEYLMSKLRFEKGQVTFPPPTPSGGDYYSFLHLMLRNSSKKLRDVLLADLSGEVFSQWTVDKKSVGIDNVRWLLECANGFIFFVNAKTIAEKRMAGVNEILDMANRLKDSVEDRPIVVVWSKADEIENVNQLHFDKVEKELKTLFDKKEIYQISNYLDVNSNPDPKSLNNLHLLEDLLNSASLVNLEYVVTEKKMETRDLFLNYRGHGK